MVIFKFGRRLKLNVKIYNTGVSLLYEYEYDFIKVTDT